MTFSIAAVLAMLGASFLVVRLLARVQARAVRVWAVAAFWCAGIAAYFFVDVNIPLWESHLYPDSAPAPLWLSLAATFVRFTAFASIGLARELSRGPVAGERNGA